MSTPNPKEHVGWLDVRTNVSWHVGRLPGRKSFCIYKIDGSFLISLGFFKTPKEAKEFIAAIKRGFHWEELP